MEFQEQDGDYQTIQIERWPEIGPISWPFPRTFTEIGISDVSLGVLVVKRLALFAAVSHCVVLTLITHSSTDVSSGQVDRHVKVA